MSDIGLAIREARLNRNFTQQTMGSKSYCSGKLISAIERGERQASVDVLEKITSELDDPRLYMEAANEITGGVFGVNWLDGESADLHRASVKEKVIEELSEAIRSINLTKVYINPKSCSKEDVEKVTSSIQETIDVFNASAIYIAVMCREYNIDIKEMFNVQKRKLIERGYIKNKKEKPSFKGL